MCFSIRRRNKTKKDNSDILSTRRYEKTCVILLFYYLSLARGFPCSQMTHTYDYEVFGGWGRGEAMDITAVISCLVFVTSPTPHPSPHFLLSLLFSYIADRQIHQTYY